MQIGIRALRADLPAVVRRAAAGEELVVTVGGRPMARLGPLAGSSTASLDDLVAVGAVLAPRRRRGEPPTPVQVPVDARTDRVLREVR